MSSLTILSRDKETELRLENARQSGGKAGSGRNGTSSLQVRCYPYSGVNCYKIVKSFRYNRDDPASLQNATQKARAFMKDYFA